MNGKPRDSWGSIRQRGKGIWQIRYTIGGKRKYETVRGTKREAEKRRAELWLEYGDCEDSMTLSEFYETVYAPDMDRLYAPKTAESYRQHWRNWIEPRFGSMALDDISPADIQDWLKSMTHSTAKHVKASLSSILTRACALGKVRENVAQRRYVLPDKSTSKRLDKAVYTKEELEEIAESCKGEFWEGCFLLAAFGGGQRSEVCGIRLEEIEEVDGYAAAPVARSVHYAEREVVIRNAAKNEYRESYIIVAPPHASRVLEIRDEGLGRGDVWLCDDGFGNPLNPSWMSEGYKRWFAKQPLRYIPFMNLRPSYATWMRDEGYDIGDVARLMRHSSTQMLHKIYDRPDANDLISRLKGES